MLCQGKIRGYSKTKVCYKFDKIFEMFTLENKHRENDFPFASHNYLKPCKWIIPYFQREFTKGSVLFLIRCFFHILSTKLAAKETDNTDKQTRKKAAHGTLRTRANEPLTYLYGRLSTSIKHETAIERDI